MVGSDFHEGKTYGHSYYDPFWAEAQSIDMPITIHPSDGEGSLTSVAYPNRERADGVVGEHPRGREREDELHQPLQSWYVRQVPDLKVVILEAGIGWLVWWLDRLDEKFEVTGLLRRCKKSRAPISRGRGSYRWTRMRGWPSSALRFWARTSSCGPTIFRTRTRFSTR